MGAIKKIDEIKEEVKEEVKENKMGTMPVNKLLLAISIPMMISMLVQALYNVVDSIFVAQINESALTAVSLVFPLQTIMISLSVGTRVGVNALLSRRLGQKRFADVNKIANIAVLLALFSYLIFLVFGIFGSEWFFAIQTQDAQVVAYGAIYAKICCVVSFGIFGQICFEGLLQATGRTFYTMIMQLVGAITNIILDPILIFGYFGFPKMGIAGAAIATVIGQILGMLLGLVFNLAFNKEIRLRFKEMTFHWPIIKEIYQIGIPAILMQSIGSVMVFLMNRILLGFTSTAAAVFGIFYKLQSFIVMPVFGLSNGMVPIVAYNYGAGRPDRIFKTLKYSVIYAVLIMFIGLAMSELIPRELLLLFDASENMMTIGVVALRILCLCYAFAGINIICISMFQAVGNSAYSLILSILRQLVVLLPVAYLMSLTGNLSAVWTSFPIAEAVTTIGTLILLRGTLKQLKTPKESRRVEQKK
ncbi:MATE family efflux transporter [Lachnospiraceae bacterium ZAX-1]